MAGKLSYPPSRIATLAPKVDLLSAALGAADLHRLYATARWKRIRQSQFEADAYTCRMCGRSQPDPSLLVCDHIYAHRGNVIAFWAGPFQTLCASPCHSKHKQQREHQQAMRGDFIR